MNVERLEQLADAVKEGVVPLGGGLVAVFNMLIVFEYGDFDIAHRSSLLRPLRTDTDGKMQDVNCSACLMGITVAKFGNFTPKELLQTYRQIDFFTEAMLLLDLNKHHANQLFYGSLSHLRTGPQMARVIRNFLMAGRVDWSKVVYFSGE